MAASELASVPFSHLIGCDDALAGAEPDRFIARAMKDETVWVTQRRLAFLLT